MALDYDFWVQGLGWNKAIKADQPYERATAQFRKDQIDQGNTVGDQSLTGWWTRGQLSFHKGAGENYYEVLDGETVLNRYKDSDSVEVFTQGQATLYPSLADLSIAATDCVPAPLSGGGGVYALTNSGVTYTAGGGTSTIATSDGGAPTSLDSSGSLYFLTNGTKIERQYDATEARTNYVTNPSFESGSSGWGAAGVGTMSVSNSRAKYGLQSLYSDSDSTFGGGLSTTVYGLTVGKTYKVSCWVYNAGTASQYPIHLKMENTEIAVSTTQGKWEQLAGTWVATVTTASLRVATGAPGSGVSHPKFFLDSVLFTEAPYANDYFDGSYPGCAWTGTPNNSTSTYATSSGNASVARVTLTGSTWKRVWWAKGRLWAVDAAGYFYALADATATVDNTASFWNSQRTGVNWTLCDSPGAAYISDGSDIFAVTVNTDGLVPSITTPLTVAQVPLGETISSITYYLGTLIVCTTAGVRVALIQNDQVFLGPLIIEGDFSASGRAGVYNTKVHVVGRPSGRGGSYVLCAIDLSQQIADLVYAWSPLATVSASASTANGAVVDATGRLYVWSGGTTFLTSRDDLSASGYLQTAFHRFGTLDNKSFASVLVRLAGTGGTVAVSRIDADGTETALSTITLPVSESTLVDLGSTTPEERVALKFTLTRATDTTKGPTLLGYQLRALPAPKRQRMIRVPLMLLDRETNRSGQLMRQDPWTRLAALEALEESNAVVSFEDRETGESGSAYIESVEVQRTSPTNGSKDGFGGLVYVTLRKI